MSRRDPGSLSEVGRCELLRGNRIGFDVGIWFRCTRAAMLFTVYFTWRAPYDQRSGVVFTTVPSCRCIGCFETPQRSELDSSATSMWDARRIRRQRNLDKIEIPEHDVMITDELLGKGGFGAVYMADYNGRNVAVKVNIFRPP